jgi:hypothetical protein
MSDHAQPFRHREIRSVQELRQPFLFPFIRLRSELAEWFEIFFLLTDLAAQSLGFVAIYSAIFDEIARSHHFYRGRYAVTGIERA